MFEVCCQASSPNPICIDEMSEVVGVLDSHSYTTVYQPIRCLTDCSVIGYEALTRFHAMPRKSPILWFQQAERVGMGAALECAVARKALLGLRKLPKDVYLSINLSPATLLTSLHKLNLEKYDLTRIVLEITEHSLIDNYEAIEVKLKPYRAKGLRLAVDDVGAGYASFRHILELAPDIIKLDRSLVQDINRNKYKMALSKAISLFARDLNINLVAEGVETLEELASLKEFGVDNGQGYFLGPPASIKYALQAYFELSDS